MEMEYNCDVNNFQFSEQNWSSLLIQSFYKKVNIFTGSNNFFKKK